MISESTVNREALCKQEPSDHILYSLLLLCHCLALFCANNSKTAAAPPPYPELDVVHLSGKAKPTALFKTPCTAQSHIHYHYKHQAGDTVIIITAAKDPSWASQIAHEDSYCGFVKSILSIEQQWGRLFAQGHTKQRTGID